MSQQQMDYIDTTTLDHAMNNQDGEAYNNCPHLDDRDSIKVGKCVHLVTDK